MKTNIIAPSNLIPLVEARLNFNPPDAEFKIYPLESQMAAPDIDSNLLLIQAPNADYARELKLRAPQAVDAFIVPAPLAPHFGFIVLASGDIPSLNHLAPSLNALAPMSNGWLHVGQIGAASFLHQLWQAILPAHNSHTFLNWDSFTPSAILNKSQPLNQPDFLEYLAKFLAQQQLQTQTLASLARRYLQENPPEKFTPHHPQTTQLFPFLPHTEASPVQQLAALLAQY